jgi:hypothetical protein
MGQAMMGQAAARWTGGAPHAGLSCDDPLTALQSVLDQLTDRPATAGLDAVCSLLEAAQQLLVVVDAERTIPVEQDMETVRSCIRAASVSVRSYLWQVHDQ